MSIEYANLEELCHIKTGAPMARARKIPEGGEARSVRALPPRSLQGGSIVDDELVTEEVGEINKEHFTREGDVVIKLSTPYDSAYIDKDHEGILVTSSVMILRKKPDAAVDMQYLSMFLGMPQTNAVLQAVSTDRAPPWQCSSVGRWRKSRSHCHLWSDSRSLRCFSRRCKSGGVNTRGSLSWMRSLLLARCQTPSGERADNHAQEDWL